MLGRYAPTLLGLFFSHSRCRFDGISDFRFERAHGAADPGFRRNDDAKVVRAFGDWRRAAGADFIGKHRSVG